MTRDGNGNSVAQAPHIDSPAIASAASTALGEIQASMILARQYPRDLGQVQARCLAEAKLAGDLFYYHWDVSSEDKETGNRRQSAIEGPSIDLALCAIRNFGNARVGQRPMIETPTAYIFTAVIFDYETGFVYERTFRQSKEYTVYGRMDKFRKEDIRFQIGQSKASRNAILNYLPAGLIDRMMEAAKNSVREQIENRIKKDGIEKVKAEIMAALVKAGASKEIVEQRIGLLMEDWDGEILTMLTGDLKAIKRGTETVESLYSQPVEPPPPNAPGTGNLDIGQMAAGDPTTHQGHEPAAKFPTVMEAIGGDKTLIHALRAECRNLAEQCLEIKAYSQQSYDEKWLPLINDETKTVEELTTIKSNLIAYLDEGLKIAGKKGKK